MFSTKLGAVADEAGTIYLRPETAQGIFVNFHTVRESARMKIPFGIAQIGKAFRNEIVKGNFIFRMIEFEQMEMQYFVKPGTQLEAFEMWKEKRLNWHIERLGIKPENLVWYQHEKLAHYADAAFDIKYKFPFGTEEIEGIHSRTDFDLRRHQEYSGKNMMYSDTETKEKYIPYVVETSAGCDRNFLMVLCDAYTEQLEEGEQHVILKLKPELAPIKAGIFPLLKKDGLPELAEKLYHDLKRHFKVQYDEAGSIGKRYYRQDEIGTPFCFTIDHETLNDQTVTVRYRDTGYQERINLSQAKAFLTEKLS
jgi:glycyl-tRNA synthetase